MVFKVPDGGKADVHLGGDVTLKMEGIKNRILLAGKQIIGPTYQYGWVDRTFFLKNGYYYDNWHQLFEYAKKIPNF